jgi:hypothetical protein
VDPEIETMLRASLTRVLSEPDDRGLALRLAEMGWDEVVADDRAGALRLLFEVRAATLSPVDALSPVLGRLVADRTGAEEAAGASLALPFSLGWENPDATTDGSRIDVGAVGPAPAGRPILVPVRGPDGPVLALVSADQADRLERTDLTGMDPSIGLRLTGAVTAGFDLLPWSVWEEAAVTARWALATELVTIALGVLADAVQYAGARQQYGRPIGTFQALQQRLAAAHASAVGAGEVALEASRSGDRWDALVAKALAGRAAETACTQAQQCFGAIGFTWEHPFPHRLRRVYLLDRLFGDWRSLETEIGRSLLASRSVPKVGRL